MSCLHSLIVGTSETSGKEWGVWEKPSLRPNLNKKTDSLETQSTFTESKQKHMRDIQKNYLLNIHLYSCVSVFRVLLGRMETLVLLDPLE